MSELLSSLSVQEFLSRLGSKSPTPGGGAVAPVVGALAGALGQMVIAYSVGKKSLAEHEDELRDAGERLARARVALLDLGEADAAAYGALNGAFSLDKGDSSRAARIAEGARGAIIPPQATMAMGVDLLRLFERLGEITNKQLASDLRIAAILAEATVRASAENVLVNLPLLDDAERGAELRRACERSISEARERAAGVARSGA